MLVRYDQWVGSADYRRGITDRLGVPFTDAGIDQVPSCAGGSSFDGDAYDGMARRMDVHDRWREHLDDPVYLSVFDAQMIALSRAIFGRIPGTSEVEQRVRDGLRTTPRRTG